MFLWKWQSWQCGLEMSRSNKESDLTAHIRWPPSSKLKIQSWSVWAHLPLQTHNAPWSEMTHYSWSSWDMDVTKPNHGTKLKQQSIHPCKASVCTNIRCTAVQLAWWIYNFAKLNKKAPVILRNLKPYEIRHNLLFKMHEKKKIHNFAFP